MLLADSETIRLITLPVGGERPWWEIGVFLCGTTEARNDGRKAVVDPDPAINRSSKNTIVVVISSVGLFYYGIVGWLVFSFVFFSVDC